MAKHCGTILRRVPSILHCIGIKGDKIFKETNFKFDTVIIDEAGKANIAESLVAMELGKKIRALWNKKDKEIEERLLWLEKRMDENE